MLFQQGAVTSFCRIDCIYVDIPVSRSNQQTHNFLNAIDLERRQQ